MTAVQQPDDVETRADRLYAARSALAETARPTRRIGVAEIVQFLTDSKRELSMEEQRVLFCDQQLRAAYRRLKSQFCLADMPYAAAASGGEVNLRRFEGGTIAVHPSRVRGQSYVVLRFDGPPAQPGAMLLENDAGDLVKRALPPPDNSGQILIVLDEKNIPDRDFLRLISDPTATGSFLL